MGFAVGMESDPMGVSELSGSAKTRTHGRHVPMFRVALIDDPEDAACARRVAIQRSSRCLTGLRLTAWARGCPTSTVGTHAHGSEFPSAVLA